jgi:hypothetical protein
MDLPSPKSRHLRDALDGKDLPFEEQESSATADFDLTY